MELPQPFNSDICNSMTSKVKVLGYRLAVVVADVLFCQPHQQLFTHSSDYGNTKITQHALKDQMNSYGFE